MVGDAIARATFIRPPVTVNPAHCGSTSTEFISVAFSEAADRSEFARLESELLRERRDWDHELGWLFGTFYGPFMLADLAEHLHAHVAG